MKLKFLIGILVLSATAYAGFLPLLHDRPKRDNANDPASKPLSGPYVNFPTLTPTPTPPPGCSPGATDDALYNFEGCIGAWESEPADNSQLANLTNTAVGACYGNKALSGVIAFGLSPTPVGTPVYRTAFRLPMSSQNWTGRTVIARAYFPPAAAGATAAIFVKSGPWNYTEPPRVSAPPGGGWVALNYNLGSLPTANDVNQFGVDFQSPTNLDGLTLAVDSIDTIGGPTPVATATPMVACGSGSDGGYVFGGFETGSTGWTNVVYTGYENMAVSAAGSPVCLGAQALQGQLTLAHNCGTLKMAFKRDMTALPAGQRDWSATPHLEARIFVPAGHKGLRASAYIKATSSYNQRLGTITSAGPGAWTVLTLDLTGLVLAERQDVKEAGVEFTSPPSDPDGPATFVIDSVRIY